MMHGGKDADEQEQGGKERDPDALGMQEAALFEAEPASAATGAAEIGQAAARV